MKEALKPVYALLVSVAILLTGQGLQGTLLPIRASVESFSTTSIGLMGAAYFLGFTFGCLLGVYLVKRVGHIRVFLAMTAIASTTALIHALVLYPWFWIIMRMLTGFCFAVLFVVIESWVNNRSSNENRGVIFSVYVMITLSVQAVGQFLMLLYEPDGIELFAIISILVTIAAIPIALSTTPAPHVDQDVSFNLKKLYKISPAAVIGCLFIGFANGSFWSLAPIFISDVYVDISFTAYFMTAVIVGGAIFQWPVGYLSDKIGRRKITIVTAALSATISFLIVSIIDDLNLSGLIITGLFWGGLTFPLYAVTVAHANDNANPNEFVMVSSSLLLMYGIGAIIGPIISSGLMAYTKSSGLFVFTGITHLILAIYLSTRVAYRESKPSEEHISFNDALNATHTASQFYESSEYETDSE